MSEPRCEHCGGRLRSGVCDDLACQLETSPNHPRNRVKPVPADPTPAGTGAGEPVKERIAEWLYRYWCQAQRKDPLPRQQRTQVAWGVFLVDAADVLALAAPVAADAGPWPPTGREPRGCPTPGACSCPGARPDAGQKAIAFLLRSVTEPGYIVGSAHCSEMEIAFAQACGRFFVHDSIGWVFRPVLPPADARPEAGEPGDDFAASLPKVAESCPACEDDGKPCQVCHARAATPPGAASGTRGQEVCIAGHYPVGQNGTLARAAAALEAAAANCTGQPDCPWCAEAGRLARAAAEGRHDG